ncbi:MAG TPA: 50S ribosomal protein L24 [Gammaproteobacteria bacterium]|jgi:large subunit ribosomal protein L24|nr:50S ribosomal protein L24 [Xanthomonadales bacterium]MCB1593570.1 50S ribosomal protein L24 [Xanthomonadales bacterium]HOP22369.1 50S ribosomal protein L24 [Gammaproteobacteria bacterium]HPI95546.1 50S ribosomal protein L24 [Gammaproteobacteria bacterium]HPQ86763.1 50S ribosomal protein L24 [Gammaproteobacteria bacterium]
MKRIKKGDEVIVIAGRSKGTRGTVLEVLKGDKLLVDNVNMVKKHVKADPSNPEKPSGIISKEAPIHLSNVMLFNAATGKADKVSFKYLENGKKIRVFRSSGEAVDA